jgi:hypothetical protein
MGHDPFNQDQQLTLESLLEAEVRRLAAEVEQLQQQQRSLFDGSGAPGTDA